MPTWTTAAYRFAGTLGAQSRAARGWAAEGWAWFARQHPAWFILIAVTVVTGYFLIWRDVRKDEDAWL